MDFTLHHFGNYIVHFENAQPWIYYYCIHSLQLLGQNLSEQDAVKMKKALSYCFSEGFGGGYKQLPHLAPTYAAFLAVL
jgi:protein farnesyltransferase subunit beta